MADIQGYHISTWIDLLVEVLDGMRNLLWSHLFRGNYSCCHMDDCQLLQMGEELYSCQMGCSHHIHSVVGLLYQQKLDSNSSHQDGKLVMDACMWIALLGRYNNKVGLDSSSRISKQAPLQNGSMIAGKQSCSKTYLWVPRVASTPLEGGDGPA